MPIEPDGPRLVRGVEPSPTPPRRYRWYHKAGALLFAVICFEVGLVLVVLPWLEVWENNYLAMLFPALQPVWPNPYLKGAISGLGVVNIYISFVEIFALRRFAEPPAA